MPYLNNSNDRPVIGISIGDFNGIGPEVVLKTLSDNRIQKICIPVVYASSKFLAKYKKVSNLQEEVHFFQIKAASDIHPKKINLVNSWDEDFDPEPGKVTTEAGKAAFLSLQKATNDLENNLIDAIVTAPVNKKNMQQENFNFPGHTEFFGSKFKSEPLMTLVSENLRVAVVTGHIPLSEVQKSITKENVAKKLNILYKSLRNDFQIVKPKIAVLGINPHAGEEGLLGTEEQEILVPLIQELKDKGLLIYGPFPADGFFGQHLYKKFDGVLAMYHDQGLTPFKTLAFDEGVNFTGGLPIIRTSPDHGTAYDIAGKNKANENSFRQAVYLAADLVKQKQEGPLQS